jgi:enoyl-CoA hydratase/carnithine racemase
MDQTDIISWEQKEEIGFLHISNGKENYLDNPDFISLDKLKQWTSDTKLKGIIIKGVGRNFSAGANTENLQELSKDPSLLFDKMNEGKKILDFIEDLNIPVIAAINGVCFGGGLEIALACHMRVASERALFAFPETNHGLIPGLGGNYRLMQLIGKKAYEFILSADMVCAAEAKKLGFINYVTETKDATELAIEKLKSMVSERSIEVIQSAMKAIKNSGKMSREEALKCETELFCNLAVNVNFHQKD